MLREKKQIEKQFVNRNKDIFLLQSFEIGVLPTYSLINSSPLRLCRSPGSINTEDFQPVFRNGEMVVRAVDLALVHLHL